MLGPALPAVDCSEVFKNKKIVGYNFDSCRSHIFSIVIHGAVAFGTSMIAEMGCDFRENVPVNANMATLTKTSPQGNETLYQMYAP